MKYNYIDCRMFTEELLQKLQPNSVFYVLAEDALAMNTVLEFIHTLKTANRDAPDKLARIIGRDMHWKLRNIRIWEPSMLDWFDRFNHKLFNRIVEAKAQR